MKVAMILTDEREEFHEYEKTVPYFGPAPTALLEGLSNLPELELHIISCTKKQMSAPEKLADNVWFHLLHVKQAGWLRSLYFGCVRAIRAKLREIQPDVVHGQGTERYCSFAAALSGFPNVITIHGNMRSIAKINRAQFASYEWCAAKLEGFTLRLTHGVICISSYTQSLVSNVAPRTWLIPNAAPSDFFQNRLSAVNSLDFLCVGIITLRKNQNALIQALDPLARKYRFKLIFLGKGDDLDPYFREFRELIKLRPWCVHKGFVNHGDVFKCLQEAFAIVLPSLEDNCPMVLLEAAAACVPIMASNVGGIPDVVQNGETGLLFDPYDATSIGSAAERYLADDLFSGRMANNARAAAEKRFLPRIVAKQHFEVYEQVLRAGSSL